MSRLRCPSCNLVNWSSAESCKRCGYDFTNGSLPSSSENHIYSASQPTTSYSKLPTIPLLLLISLLLTIGFYLWNSREITYPPGILIAEAPEQLPLSEAKSWTHGKNRITALAEFKLRARVLSTERYWFDRASELSPLDLALGWGPMSDQKVLDQLDIWQSGRWYRYSYTDAPISRHEIINHSANMHMIPATTHTANLLKSVRKGDLINLTGYLVSVTGDDGYQWRSSLTRSDEGDGSCEVVWVESVYRD
jgi:hypothetical protein